MDVKDLELIGIIAFDGISRNALRLHPDKKHLIYPMGNNVAINHIETGRQTFLIGHTNLISTVCVSPCGNYVASGQINHLGFKAMVIIWDYKDRTIKGSYEIHKVRVEDVCFSPNSEYLISLGGKDDGNVVIWDVRSNNAICGSFASNETAGIAYTLACTNIRDQCFVTGGEGTLKVWRINLEARKVHNVDVKVGKLKRSINCIVINERDEDMYCGTASGDIIKARLNYANDREQMEPVRTPVMTDCYSKIPRSLKKRNLGEGDLYSGGVTNLLLLETDKMVVGAGDGTVELIEIIPINASKVQKVAKLPSTPRIKTHLSKNVCGTVSSIVRYKNDCVLVGTVLCEIFQIKLSNFDAKLMLTCHTGPIYSIAFPWNSSEIFATSGKDDIRLWRLQTQKELLRITVPNFSCSCLCFSHDGRMIVSAWSDGVIRAFTPQSGTLIFAIHNAHVKAVGAVTINADGQRLISGGCDGQIRIWDIKANVQRLVSTFKEHRSAVTSLQISPNDEDLISSSTDGTCIVWDVVRCARKHVLMGKTMYMAACFSRNGLQILTCGTDRKIAYWETWDGTLVREIEGSSGGALNCIDTSPDGRYFITGSNDYFIKHWEYDTANTTHIGVGHAAIITACRFSPDSKHVITVSADGAIIVWKSPFEAKFDNPESESVRSKSSCALSQNEKQQLQLKNLQAGDENVACNSPHDEAVSTVKTVHTGHTRSPTCRCDSNEPTQQICCCLPEKEQNREDCSAKSLISGKSSKSPPLQSNKKTVASKTNSLSDTKVKTPTQIIVSSNGNNKSSGKSGRSEESK